ncbi:MAG TPA: methionine/alanine import family NSS transporter small subunit [Microbacterium sp.]|nr:methionine/alanine import family NSS transporter small subunit [Microbacterium sp.]
MTAIAILFLIISAVVVWGGLAGSVIFLARRPETAFYAEGGEDPGE